MPFRSGILPAIAANTAFYGTILAASLVLLRTVGVPGNRETPLRVSRRMLLLLLIVSWVFYFLAGIYFTAKAGPHSGDEGHFMIQAESLWQDHDLDIKNNLYATRVPRYVMRNYGRPDAEPDIRKMRLWYHVSERSRDPYWYSWHSPGLSFVLAPVFPLGNWGRHLVLGLIAAFSICGLLKLCERFGAGRNAAALILALFGAGVFWGVYSVRALPEVLGAGLTAWMMVGVMTDRNRGWTSVLLTSACAAALPWAYARFIPVSLLGTAFCALRCLVLEKTWRNKIAKASVTGMVGALSIGLYFFIQHAMFSGWGSRDVGEHLFTYPRGIWRMMSDKAGILPVFPAVAWLVLSTVHLAATDKERRWPSLAALLLLASILATSCGSGIWHGGNCIPGRYLVVVIPLLIAPASVDFDRQGSVGRWWFIALLVFSVMQFALLLARLPSIGPHFAFPLRALRSSTPLAHGLVNCFELPGINPLNAMAIAFYAITGATFILGRRAQALQAAVLAALVAAMIFAGWPAA